MAKQSAGPNWLAILLLLLLVAGGYYCYQQRRHSGYKLESAAPGQVVSEDHWAPAEDLEQIDLDRLDRTQKSVEIAMYAFTDRPLADELVKLARRGVHVRIYRDGGQFEDEQRNAEKYNEESAMDALHGEARIEVRVKPASRKELMHMKAYVIDGRVLRDGSANWSQAGEKLQDNNAHFTNDGDEIQGFERDFEQMWARSDNTRVQ